MIPPTPPRRSLQLLLLLMFGLLSSCTQNMFVTKQ